MATKHPHLYKILLPTNSDFPRILKRMRYSKKFLEKNDNIYAIDIETAKHPDYLFDPKAGLCPHRSQIRLIQIANDETGESFVFDMFELNKTNQLRLYDWIEDNEFFAHFAQFEASHFQYNGIVNPKLHCTQVLYRMHLRSVYAHPRDFSASLQAVCKRMLKLEISKTAQTSDWGRPQLCDEQIIYAARDAAYTIIIGRKLLPMIRNRMPKAYLINKLAVNPIARMSLNGIYFDSKGHKKEIASWQKIVDSKYRRLKTIFGDYNFNSGVQLASIFEKKFPKKVLASWPKTEKGRLSTSSETLQALQGVKGIDELCEYKKHQKLISTYGKSLIANVSKATGRIHCSFSLGYTNTGRLSSFNPNLQNLPRGDALRSKFCRSNKSTILVGADFSQIESKIAALISGDTIMLDVFRNERDIYVTAASQVLGIPEDEVTKEQRQYGKALVLGLLFGMGPSTFQGYAKVNFKVDLSEREAEEAVTGFHKAFPRYREWQLEQSEEAADTFQSYTRSGMIRKLDSNNYYTCSMNTPIQGSAAEIMLASLIRMDRKISESSYSALIVNCVHDEILVECTKKDVKRVAKDLKKSMERGFKDVFPDTCGIKNLVDVRQGNNWAEVH